jgi:hypothetical protein
MEKKYTITQEQFEQLDYIQSMLRQHSDNIRELCSTEKDDVVYGFQLGQTYTYLTKHFIEMMELMSEIRESKQ